MAGPPPEGDAVEAGEIAAEAQGTESPDGPEGEAQQGASRAAEAGGDVEAGEAPGAEGGAADETGVPEPAGDAAGAEEGDATTDAEGIVGGPEGVAGPAPAHHEEDEHGGPGDCGCSGPPGTCTCDDRDARAGGSPGAAGSSPGAATIGRAVLSGAMLQRLSVDDVTGAIGGAAGAVGSAVSGAAGAVGEAVGSVLPSWITDAPGEEQRGADQARTDAEASAAEGSGELEAGVEQPRSEVDAGAQAGEEQGDAEQAVAQQADEQGTNADGDIREQATEATSAVGGTASSVAPLLNPAVVAAQPEQVAQASAALTEAGSQATGGEGAGATLGGDVAREASTGVGAGGPSFTCDTAEILSAAGEVARDVVNRGIGVAEGVFGRDRVQQVVETVSRIGRGIRKVAGAFRKGLASIGAKVRERFTKARDAVMRPVRAMLDGARKRVETLKNRARDLLRRGRQAVTRTITRIRTAVRDRVNRILTSARSTVGGLVRRVKDFLGGTGRAIWDRLPNAVKAPVAGIGRAFKAVARGIGTLASGVRRLAERLRKKAVEWVKNRINRSLRLFARLRKKFTAFRLRVRRLVRNGASWLRRRVSALIPEPVKRAARWAAEQVAKLGRAARGVIDKVAGKVCAAVDPVAERCADQYLPDIGAGGTSSIKLSATRDVTVPLHEIGVPGNLKVGEGSSVEVSRAGGAKPAVFVVKVVGDSSLALTEGKTKTDVRVGVDLPSGNKSKMDEVWRNLVGGGGGAGGPQGGGSQAGGPPAGAPQTGGPRTGGPDVPQAGQQGQPPVAAGAGGGGWKGSLEAGIRGKSELTYRFTAGGNNCEGVGGLVALLASYGISGALPAPFDRLAGMVTEQAFRSSLTKALFTAEAGVTGTVELSQDGVGKLQGRAGITESLTIGQERVNGQWRTVQHLTLSASLSGSAALDLGVPMLSNFGGGASLGIVLSLKLAYMPDLQDIVPTEAKAEGTASVNVNHFDPAMFSSIPGAVDAINRALGAMRGPRNAMIEGKASYTARNLDAIVRRLSAYFHDTPADSVDVDGVIAAFRAAWREVATRFEAQVKYKQTQRAGVSIRAGADLGEGAVLEAGAAVSAEYAEERILFTYSSDGGIQAPPPPQPQQRQVDQEGDRHRVLPPPDGGGGSRPQGRPPTVAEVLNMSPAEFEADPEAQRVLYDGAIAFRGEMRRYGRAMIEEAGAEGEAISILKRDDFEGFVAGILEKCKRKGYARIGMMPDIVRGRFNLSSEADVETVVDAMQAASKYRVVEIVRPRREVPGEGFGYPRFHVVISDPDTTFIHEWQVGTTAVTRVFEDEGIVIPDGVNWAGHRRDIHDVQYDVFNAIIKHHPEVAAKYRLKEYEQEVDRLAARAGRRGDELLDRDKQLKGPAREELKRLHDRASEILQGIVDEHGADFINRLLKPSGAHSAEEPEVAGAL